MSIGKTASQAGHAYLGSFLLADPALQKSYHSEFPISPGTKVCLQVSNLDQLLKAEYLAKESGLPFFLVTDSGCENFFGGEPTITALGIGPATKSQIKHITKKLKLL